MKTDWGYAPEDWENPNWETTNRVHQWTRYVSIRVRELWDSFTDEQKVAIAQQSDDIAGREEWD